MNKPSIAFAVLDLIYRGETMATVPDDIKIIAQFLAEHSRVDDWQALTRHALQLKRDLSQRGAYRIVRHEKR
jgi:hypothetical protein